MKLYIKIIYIKFNKLIINVSLGNARIIQRFLDIVNVNCMIKLSHHLFHPALRTGQQIRIWFCVSCHNVSNERQLLFTEAD